MIPDAFAGDAHAFLVAVYKDPKFDHHTRQDAARAALPYEKPRLQAVTLANEGGEPPLGWSRLRASEHPRRVQNSGMAPASWAAFWLDLNSLSPKDAKRARLCAPGACAVAAR
jgi:hypothetical protein